MKTLLLAGATLALLTPVNALVRNGAEAKAPRGDTWAGISQRADTSSAGAEPSATLAH